jgi:hypothetical protein
MSKLIIQIALSALIVALVFIEKSLYGTFCVFNLLQISILTILLISNFKSNSSHLAVIFSYGIATDIMNSSLVGISPLLLILWTYIYYYLKMRFPSNKIILLISNLIFALLLTMAFLGFSKLDLFEVLLMTLLNYFISMVFWFRK